MFFPESSTESEDYSYDESCDEDESNSDLEEEFIDAFGKISATSRNWRRGSFKPRLFSFDSNGCGLSSTIKNLLVKHHLISLNYFSILNYSK